MTGFLQQILEYAEQRNRELLEEANRLMESFMLRDVVDRQISKEDVEESWRRAIHCDTVVRIVNVQGGPAYLVQAKQALDPQEFEKLKKEIEELVKALSTGSYNAVPTMPGQPLKIEPLPDIDFEPFPVKKIVCECGAEKCGSPAHSSWCPRYSKE